MVLEAEQSSGGWLGTSTVAWLLCTTDSTKPHKNSPPLGASPQPGGVSERGTEQERKSRKREAQPLPPGKAVQPALFCFLKEKKDS